jgi:hypothetical protein
MPTPSEYIETDEYKHRFGNYTSTNVNQIVLTDTINKQNRANVKATVDQTTIIQNTNQGIYTPKSPAPTNVLAAHLELAKLITQSGNLLKMTSQQAVLYALNPSPSIVNPSLAIVPGEGIIPTSLGPETVYPSVEATYQKTYGGSTLGSVSVASFSKLSFTTKKTISGVEVKTIEGNDFRTIFGDTSIANDQTRKAPDRAFETNAILDKTSRSFDSDGILKLEPDTAPDATSDKKPEPNIAGMAFPFYFESLNYGENQKYAEKFISFQATFKGLREVYTPQWNPKQYFGRSTAIYTYANTQRTLTFNFTIFAQTKESLWLVKQRVNWLAKHCYPTYINLLTTKTKIISEAPIIKVTIGDLFRDTPGIITSLEYDWDIEGNNLWELSKDKIMPHAVNVTLGFTILHDKFMRNDPQSLSQGNESSDFYSFILPNTKKKGFNVDAFTSAEVDTIVSKAIGS